MLMQCQIKLYKGSVQCSLRASSEKFYSPSVIKGDNFCKEINSQEWARPAESLFLINSIVSFLSGNLIYFILSLSTAQRLTQILRVECEGGEIFEQSKFQILNLSAHSNRRSCNSIACNTCGNGALVVFIVARLHTYTRFCQEAKAFARKSKNFRNL